MSYKKQQYERTEKLIENTDVFNGDKGRGVFRGNKYPFVLNDNNNNLYKKYGKSICSYFDINKIAWWGGKLTNHTLSSQVACLNHLYPIRDDKNTVLSLIQNIYPDIIDVLKITTDGNMSEYIQFEAISDSNHLNERYSTRGSNCTSIDALIYGQHKDGRKILFPIEWKYVESYGNEDKANGKSGSVRKSRYTDLINQSKQLKSACHDVYYFEPFYQLMRQTLWAEQMIAHKNTETIKADEYLHIHVIPSENKELLNKKYKCSCKEMEETWRECLENQGKYIIIPPSKLMNPTNNEKYSDLIAYLKKRYWYS